MYNFHTFERAQLMSVDNQTATFQLVRDHSYKIAALTTAKFSSKGILFSHKNYTKKEYERDDEKLMEPFDFFRSWAPPSKDYIKLMKNTKPLTARAWGYSGVQGELNTASVTYISKSSLEVRNIPIYVNAKDFWWKGEDARMDCCYSYLGLTIAIFALTKEGIVYIISKDTWEGHTILAKLEDKGWGLQYGDCHTYIWLVNGQDFVIYNNGDVYSVVIAQAPEDDTVRGVIETTGNDAFQPRKLEFD